MPNIVTIPFSDQPAINKNDSFTQSWFMFFQDLWRAVRRNVGIKLGGTLNVDTESKSNLGNAETDLITYNLAAKSMANNGDYLEIIAWGIFASNANNKTLKLYFGNQIIYQTDANAANNANWQFKAIIIRKSSNSQEICTELLSNSSTIQNDSNYPIVRIVGNQDLSASLIVKCTGQGSATNDLIQNTLIIKLNPYN